MAPRTASPESQVNSSQAEQATFSPNGNERTNENLLPPFSATAEFVQEDSQWCIFCKLELEDIEKRPYLTKGLTPEQKNQFELFVKANGPRSHGIPLGFDIVNENNFNGKNNHILPTEISYDEAWATLGKMPFFISKAMSPEEYQKVVENHKTLTLEQITKANRNMPMAFFEAYGTEVTGKVLGTKDDIHTFSTDKGIVVIPENRAIIIPQDAPLSKYQKIEFMNMPYVKWFEQNENAGVAVEINFEPTQDDEMSEEDAHESNLSVHNLLKDSELDRRLDFSNPANNDPKDIAQAKSLVYSNLARGTPVAMKNDVDKTAIQSFQLSKNGEKVNVTFDKEGKLFLEGRDGRKVTDLPAEDVLYLYNLYSKGGPESGETFSGVEVVKPKVAGLNIEATILNLTDEKAVLEKTKNMIDAKETILAHYLNVSDSTGATLEKTLLSYLTKNYEGYSADTKLDALELGRGDLLPTVLSPEAAIFKYSGERRLGIRGRSISEADETIMIVKNDKGIWEVLNDAPGFKENLESETNLS